jgi:XTP/dITP diphosphohydrolase
MKKQIVFATGNAGKLREVREILSDLGSDILSMKEAGAFCDVEETGTTFTENAFLKAEAVHEVLKDSIVLADDSGLVIDYLNGEPGIYSARYIGRDTPYAEKMADILRRMEKARGKERSARFTAAIACILPDGRRFSATASMEGEIAMKPAGQNGFGYDPILYLPEYRKTSAELSEEEKNAISHRGKALRLMKEKLKGIL